MPSETIIVAPAIIYLAPAGTAEVAVDVNPPNAWDVWGQSYWDDGGITVTVNRNVLEERTDSSPYVERAFNGDIDLMAAGVVKDLSLETLKVMFNDNTITAVAATNTAAGYKGIDLEMGIDIAEYAMLFRFYTPYNTGGLTNAKTGAQLWLPRAYQSGGFSTPLTRAQAGRTPFEFKAMKHATLGVGKLKFKTANATA